MTATTKHCPGFAALDIPAHDAPLSAFGASKGQPDGLTVHCKADANLYSRAWTARKRAIAKAQAMPAGADRDAALAAAEAMPPNKRPSKPEPEPLLPAKGLQAVVSPLRQPDPADLAKPKDAAVAAGLVADEPREQAMAAQANQPGWTTTRVAGATYAIPADTAAVETSEGQAALQVVHDAKKAQWRQAKREQAKRAKEDTAAATA